MKNKTIFLVIGLALVLLLAVATIFYQDLSQQFAADPITPTQNPSASQEAQPGTDAQEEEPQLTLAPDFTVFDGEGNPVSLSDFRGKPVIVNFWASWCGPCKSEMPAFQQAWETYGDRVEFLLINLTDNHQETVASAQAFLASTEYTFPVYFDTQLSGTTTYGVVGIPASYFVDKDGYLVAGANSALDYATLEYGISLILDE